jgi:hypothetical protein
MYQGSVTSITDASKISWRPCYSYLRQFFRAQCEPQFTSFAVADDGHFSHLAALGLSLIGPPGPPQDQPACATLRPLPAWHATDGQSVAAQVVALRRHGAGKVFREVASGAKTDRMRLRRLLDQLDAGDVLMVTRLDRLARSTRDLLNTLAAITEKEAGFRSLGDAWADTTTPHGRLMLTVLGGWRSSRGI